MLLSAILLFLVGLINIIVGSLVFARNVKKALNFFFFMLLFSIGVWAIGIGCFLASNDADVALGCAKVYYFAPLILVQSLIFFCYLFPRKVKLRKSKIALFSLPFLAVIVPLLGDKEFLTAGIVYHPWGKEVALNHVHYLLYSLFVIGGFAMGLTLMLVGAKNLKGIVRKQVNLFLFGMSVACLFGLWFNLFLPWVSNYRLIWVGPLATTVFVVAMAISIIKHKMFDLRLVAARSLAYIISILILTVCYGCLAFIITHFVFNVSVSLNLQVLLSAVTAVSALCFPFIKRFFDKATNRLFYRDAYDPQEFLKQLNNAVVSTLEIEILLARAAKIIGQNLKTEFCVVELRNNDGIPRRVIGTKKISFSDEEIDLLQDALHKSGSKLLVTEELICSGSVAALPLEKHGIDVLIKLANNFEHASLGYLIIGPKKSGNPYSAADLRILNIVSNELSIVIQNALRYEEIQRFNETLEAEVHSATLKLQKANEKLKRLDKTKDDFISMASHQLRTPLTSAKGFVSMVLDGDAGPISNEQREMLKLAYGSTQRMVYLIADLLNASRLRTGKFVIESNLTNLADIIAEEVDQLQETARGVRVKLIYEKPEGFPDVVLDETKIRQVIMNFMDNAVFYSPHGGEVLVSLKDTGKSIKLTITDNGIGIPKDEQPRLFTKFFRASNAKKTRPDGTGLGLYMAKKVIIAQGGAIIFKSKEGEGSTFGFIFDKSKILPTENAALPRSTTINPSAILD